MGRGKATADFSEGGYQPAGIYGWRKQCVYACILFILVVVIMNLALTVWILRVLDFSIEGLQFGKLTLTDEGVQLKGEAEFVKDIYTSKIVSKSKENLHIESSRDIKLTARNKDHKIVNTLNVGKERIETCSDVFEVQDLNKKVRFNVSDTGVFFGLDEVTYSGKATFSGSLETPAVRGPISDPLRLESSSSSMVMSGMEGVSLKAPAGNLLIKSSDDIVLDSESKIFLNSSQLYLKNIAISQASGAGKAYDDVYQLCMCHNGQLFLAPADSDCQDNQNICS